MRFEFIGSFVAFGLALIVQPARSKLLQAYLIIIAVALCHYISAWYVAFPVGVALAAWLPRQKQTVPPLMTLGLIVLWIYLAGYSDSARQVGGGAFRPLNWLVPNFVSTVYVNIVGAAALLLAVETSPAFHSRLSARWGVFLGKLSFPLYLVHVPVLCSLGSRGIRSRYPQVGAPLAQIAAALTTIIGAFAVAYPLAQVNQWWISFLNKIVVKIAQQETQQHSANKAARAKAIASAQRYDASATSKG